MKSAILLGLDLGTTNCKVLAIDVSGRTVASIGAPTPALPSGEYDADALWRLFAQLIRDLLPSLPGLVIGVGVSSMAESGVLVDAAGEPCAPVITWHDLRTKPLLDQWRARVDPLALYRMSGLSFDHIYSAPKLQWHQAHTPAAFARAAHWLGLADWLSFKLAGVCSMSLPMASRTMLFDPRARDWSPELLALAGLPAHLLPPLVESGAVIGGVTDAAARATGLTAGIPVAAGGHDHICGALAIGAVEPGVILDSAGTSEAFMATLTHSIADHVTALPGFGCGCHAAPGRFYLLGGLMGGGVVNWLSETFAGDTSLSSVTALMRAAAQSPIGANGVRFVPYLRGSGPPKRDPNSTGAWLGLRLAHTRGDMMRAAMEGLSFGFRRIVELMQVLGEFRADELRVTGGGARNAWWQQLKADVLGLPIVTSDESEASAKGAALLAGVGAGAFADADAAARTAFRPAARFEPRIDAHAMYERLYMEWGEDLRAAA
jgi:xylulokinase